MRSRRRKLYERESANLAALTTDEFQEQVSFWSTAHAVAERALRDARTRQAERKGIIDRLQEQQVALENRLAEIDKALVELENSRENLPARLPEFNAQSEQLRSLIEPAERELESSEAQEADLQRQETEGQSNLAQR